MTAHTHTGTDKRRRANPRAGFNMDWFYYEFEVRRRVIMVARAEEGALRKADMAFNHDWRQIQQPAFFANPDVVTNFQPPGKMNIHTGTNNHAVPNFGTKPAKPKDAHVAGPR